MNRACLDCLAIEHACCKHDVNPSCEYCGRYVDASSACECECVAEAEHELRGAL